MPKSVQHLLDADEIREMYHDFGLSIQEIANYKNVSPPTIRCFMMKSNIERKSLPEARIKIYPNLTLNENMFYVLGVLYGDGSFTGKYRTGFGVSEYAFAESYCEALKKIRLNAKIRPYTEKNGTIMYGIDGNSKLFMDWLHSFGVEELYEMIGNNKEFAAAFVRGFYESEGGNEIKRGGGLDIRNTNYNLLEFVYFLLIDVLRINCVWHKPKKYLDSNRKECYRIYIGLKKDQVNKFMEIINPCIKNECPKIRSKATD